MFCELHFRRKQVLQSGQLGQQLAGPRKTVGPLDLVAVFVVATAALTCHRTTRMYTKTYAYFHGLNICGSDSTTKNTKITPAPTKNTRYMISDASAKHV